MGDEDLRARARELETVLRQARGVLADIIKAEDDRNEAAVQAFDEGLIDRDCDDNCPQDDTCDCPGTVLIGRAVNRRNFHEGDCLRAIDAALAKPEVAGKCSAKTARSRDGVPVECDLESGHPNEHVAKCGYWWSVHPATKESRLYYVQDRRSFVGNCALLWGKERSGYVCNPSDAHVFTEAEILEEHWRDTDVPLLKDEVDRACVRHLRADGGAFREVKAATEAALDRARTSPR